MTAWAEEGAGAAGTEESYARAALSFVADPGDELLGALLRSASAAEVLAAVREGGPGAVTRLVRQGCGEPLTAGRPAPPVLPRAVQRWRARTGDIPAPGRLAAWLEDGFRLVCPGDPEWPSQLDDLGDARPVVLWLKGEEDLRFAALRSVSVVGARAATAYGTHVTTRIAADLAGRGWTIVSGGAYGIDASAHRGALVCGGCTVAVLASGLAFGYPKGHADLFSAITGSGVMVSECPPDQAPSRPGFLVRNRVIAALSRGTLVVEAARRSGALNTARHARELNRHLMAVPGPVTSAQSAGCHELIRESGAVCVTGADDVIELLAPLGEIGGADREGREPARSAVPGGDDAQPCTRPGVQPGVRPGGGPGGGHLSREPAVPVSDLDAVTVAVLRSVPASKGRGPATIAALAGTDLDTAMRCLGLLAATGYIQRCAGGWRLRKARESRR